ncbi:MAG: ligase-associated DNA damage response DEXH box helicase [Verrucomicrobiota bacterium]
MTRTNLLTNWFEKQGWKPFPFQKQTWKAYLEGKSGLLHAPTGLGKTYAVLGGPLLDHLNHEANGLKLEGLLILWITPLRALANDTLKSIQKPIDDLKIAWNLGARHGDVSAYSRKKQREKYPSILIITPESLSLLFTYPETRERFKFLQCVVVDEWHELLGTKRGVQTELALARLRAWNTSLRIWGLSATLGNIQQAMRILLGKQHANHSQIISGKLNKKIQISTIIPPEIENFPWSGHLGLKLVPQVVEQLNDVKSTLLFTNTRSQTELWYQGILKERPEWKEKIALHHGSIDREMRLEVERKLKEGELKVVVCTSSLDLGVDFTPVDQVIQVGSPKGIARLMQRAGRSGHQPGQTSRIIGVPTNAFELIEFSAARSALKANQIESRIPCLNPLDVLLQHINTIALEGKTALLELQSEVLSTYSFSQLSEQQWQWAVDFVSNGGKVLKAYPQYRKVVIDAKGILSINSSPLARMHRMSIGTITGSSEVLVKFISGKTLGSVEEYFISKLKPNDSFQFAGKKLQLIRFRDMTAYVRLATRRSGHTPSWQGGRAPLSSELAEAVSKKIIEKNSRDPEMLAVAPILSIQESESRIPHNGCLLVESTKLPRQFHISFYPFAGRLVNQGLSSLIAYRLTKNHKTTLKTAANDYGFSLQTSNKIEFHELMIRHLISRESLLDDLLACMNATELARRQFRDIASIAGLIIKGYPGQRKKMRQLQSSSTLLYDMFQNYDPKNLLLQQSQREILEGQLEFTRLSKTLERLEKIPVRYQVTERLTPMAFPLWAEILHTEVSSETWHDRIQEMVSKLEDDSNKLLSTI